MSKSSTEVTTVTNTGALPDLYETVESNDRQLPSIYLLQGLSQAVQNNIGKPGEVIVGLGADDPDPTFLIGGDTGADSFTAYVLDRRRSYSRYPQGGQMEWLTKEEYDAARQAGERDVWVNWHYVIAIPEVDDFVPMRLMLSRTAGLKASKALNFLVDKSLAMGSMPVAKFSVSEATSKTTGSKYSMLMVTSAEATQEGLDAAIKQQQFFGGQQRQSREDAPPLPASNQPDI
jgi:hypothetical protein